MILLCECCNKPIERLDDIKLIHKNGCEVLPVIEQQKIPKPDHQSLPSTSKIDIYPDGRMTPANAALYTGFAVQSLAIYRSRGEGPKFVKRNGRIFYSQTDLDEWLNESGDCISTAQARFKQNASK